MMSGPSRGSLPLGVPNQVANLSLNMFSHKRSVIIDMVMIQLISAILVMLFVLVFKASDISQTDASMAMIAIFISMMGLTTIYTRISRM
jgi:hypothetical protein